jgi:SAM-dependent methyltransferase
MKENNLNTIWNDYTESWHGKTYLQPIIPIISDYLFTKKNYNSLLDFGCGYGKQSFIFNKYGYKVTGLDSSLERITKAKLEFPHINFLCYKFEDKLPFKDNSFDIIYSHSVLQYVDHPLFLKECNRILKKDGSIILIENLKNNPITRVGRVFLKLTNFKFQSYPWNHFTIKEFTNTKKQFDNSSFNVFYLLSPLAYIKPFKKKFSFFSKIDDHLLKVKCLRNFAWLSLFIGQKKTCDDSK